jgi:hypothetical protein
MEAKSKPLALCRRRLCCLNRQLNTRSAKSNSQSARLPSPLLRKALRLPSLATVYLFESGVEMAFDARYRDKDGEISRKHGNTAP